MQRYVNQMASGMQNVSPEQMQRMKDMLAGLNEMLEQRERGEDPGFEQFMERFGDFFPENPQTLDELLEVMAQRMAAMQAMLNSMTPEQRAQLQELTDQLLEDMDLRWQMDQLGQHLRSLFPQMGWDRPYNFQGMDPLGFAEAVDMMQQLGDIDQLENLLRGATSPGALAEADLDRVRDLLGDDAARSLERLAELARMLEEAGLIENREGRFELTPKGIRRIGAERAVRPLHQAGQGQDGPAPDHADRHRPRAQLREQALRVRRSVQPRPPPHDPQRHPAAGERHAGAPLAGRLRDRAHRERHPLVDRADARPVAVDADAGQLPVGQEGGDGAALADLQPVPPRLPRASSASARWPGCSSPSSCPRCSWDFVYGTNMQHAFLLSRQLLAKQSGTKQIIMITDGEPTAHIDRDGDVFFNYPPVPETIEATLREVARCTRDGIRINTFMLDATSYLKAFVERLTQMNRGRAFFTTPETLGDYVLVDFIEHKRQQSGRGRRAG